MGLQDDLNYTRARDFISKIEFNNVLKTIIFCSNFQDMNLNLFEVTIRYLGGLLSAFTLTKDPMYKDKAQLLGEKMLVAFETKTGVPHMDINLGT
jgi:hypothetical protein